MISGLINRLKSNLFGGPGKTSAGFTKPIPSRYTDNIGLSPTAVLDSNPLRFGMYQFPKDVFENDQLGHYMVFYVNETKRTKYDYSSGADKQHYMDYSTPVPTGLPANERRLSAINQKVTGTNKGTGEPNLAVSDRNQRLKTGIGSSKVTTRRITDSIALYLPPNVQDTTSAAYDDTTTGLLGFAAGQGADFLKSIGLKDYDAATDTLLGVGTTFALEVARRAAAGLAEALAGAEGGVQLANRVLGQADNPFVEVLFNTMNVRTFTYNFNMAPRNIEETAEIQQIIQLFRFHMSPEMQGSNSRYLTLPSEFDIHYMYKHKDGYGQENDFYNRIATCVLTDVVTNYTPNGVRSFENGAPTAITMSLTFKETETLTKEKIQSGF